jgi:hypothetical protein
MENVRDPEQARAWARMKGSEKERERARTTTRACSREICAQKERERTGSREQPKNSKQDRTTTSLIKRVQAQAEQDRSRSVGVGEIKKGKRYCGHKGDDARK